MLLDEGGTVGNLFDEFQILGRQFCSLLCGEQVFHLVDVVNQIRLILCSYGDNVVHGQISEHAGFNLYFLGVHFPFHLVTGFQFLLRHDTDGLEHPDALRFQVVVENDGNTCLAVQTAAGCFGFPFIAVTVAVKVDGFADFDVPADDFEDGGDFRLPLFNQFVHIFLEFHQLLGKGGVQRNHGTGAVGLGTHSAELEAVAGEGERAGAVAVGEIFIEGQKVAIKSPSEALQLGIGEVFQELNVCMQMDVTNNIFIGNLKTKKHLVDDKTLRKEAEKILQDTVGLYVDPTLPVRSLSIAEQQMVEIAKVISRGGKVIVFDEPTTSLTKEETNHLYKIIEKLKKQGMGIVYITHRFEELEILADRVTVMRDGKFIRTMNYADTTNEELVNLMVGREMTEKYPDYKRKIGEVVLHAKGIKNKSGINVDEIVVHKGEIVGMAGLVGAGRTESMRILIGADKGKIDELTLFDKQVKQFKNVHSSIENGVVYMTEDRKADGLALSLNVEKNISIASLKKLSRRGLVSEKKAEENANTYVEKLQIKISGLEQQTKLLSGGNQQKVILAKWMSCNPRILIFDEPTKGIDVGAKFEIYKLMNQLSDAGLGIILISSDLSEVIGMSDRVYVYREGHTVGELSHAEIEASNIMQYATGIKKQEGR